MRLWVEDADWNFQLFVDDPHGLSQVRVICDDYELIAVVLEGIDEHVRGDVYVGAFFFHLQHACEALPTRGRRGERHGYRALQIVTVMHRQVRQSL